MNRTWGNAAGGTFNVATNWLGGVAPTSTDLPIFQLNSGPSGYVVNFVAPATTTGMTMQTDNVTFALNNNTYTNTGSLVLSTNNGNENARLIIGGGTISATSTQIANTATNTGTLTIGSGGFASLGTTIVGGAGIGSLIVNNGGDVVTSGITVGSSAFSAGTMTFTNSGTTLTAGAISVGAFGTGFTSLTNGASASTASVGIGGNAGGTGTLQISGSGWAASGGLSVGLGSTGVCDILGAGSLTTTSGHIGGNSNAAVGRVTITGSGSRWVNSGALTVGRGTLSVFSGGTASTTGTTLAATSTPGVDNPVGPALVARGAGSQINCGTQLLSIGGSPTTPGSVIDISSGGRIIADTLSLGSGNESVCDVSVDGLGSQLNATVGVILLAGSPNSRLTMRLSNYATVFGAGSFLLATSSSSAGTIEISSHAALNISADAGIGGNVATSGAGYVSVSDAATFNLPATATMRVFGNSTLRLDGGTVSTGSLNLFTGATFTWNSGTLALTGNSGATIASTSSLGNRVSLSNGRTLSAPVSTLVDAGGLLTLDGGALRTGFLGIVAGGEVDLRDNRSTLNATSSSVQGLLHGDGRLDMNLIVNPGGEVRAESGKRLSFYDPGNATHTNDGGQLTLLGGTLEFNSPLLNESRGRITGRGTLIVAGAGIDNFGTMTFSAGTSDVMARIANRVDAKVIVTGGSTTTFFSPITTETRSELRVSTGSTGVFLGDVSGAGAITGPGIKDFEATGTALRINGTGTTRVGPSANISAATLRDNALFVEGTIGIAPNGTAASVTRVGTLAIDPLGQLDLSNNDAILTATSAGTVFTYLQSGYNFGGQDGVGGIVSSTARNNPNGNTTLGMLRGQEYLDNNGDPNFDGVAVAPTDVLIKCTYFGDVDFNGAIDASDYNLIDFGFVNHLTGWGFGDADFSGGVDASDYNVIDFAFSTQNGTILRAMSYLEGYDRTMNGMEDPSLQMVAEHFEQFGVTYATGFLSHVPEPTSATLLAIGASTLLARRRRRCGK